MSCSDSPQYGDVKILVVRTVWRNIHPAIITNNRVWEEHTTCMGEVDRT